MQTEMYSLYTVLQASDAFLSMLFGTFTPIPLPCSMINFVYMYMYISYAIVREKI